MSAAGAACRRDGDLVEGASFISESSEGFFVACFVLSLLPLVDGEEVSLCVSFLGVDEGEAGAELDSVPAFCTRLRDILQTNYKLVEILSIT